MLNDVDQSFGTETIVIFIQNTTCDIKMRPWSIVLNEELQKMGEVSRRGLLEDTLESIGHLSEAVASASLDKVVANFQLLEQNKSLNPEAFNQLSKELRITFDNLGYLDDRFIKFADTLHKTGTLSEKQIENLDKLDENEYKDSTTIM